MGFVKVGDREICLSPCTRQADRHISGENPCNGYAAVVVSTLSFPQEANEPVYLRIIDSSIRLLALSRERPTRLQALGFVRLVIEPVGVGLCYRLKRCLPETSRSFGSFPELVR
jgi:hypothetical protein